VSPDWKSLPFEDCIEPISYPAKVQRKDFLAEGDYPVVSQEEGLINGYWASAEDVLTVDRPVVIFGDHTRVLKYIDFDFVLGADGVKVLKPRQFLDPRFFYYQLRTAKLDALGYARHYRLLREHHVAFPPLPEQRRIVSILDEAFEAIATAKANTERNLENAREVFESRVQSVFAVLDREWPRHRFDDLASETLIGLTRSAQEQGEDLRCRYVKMNNISAENIFDGSRLVSVDASDVEVRKFRLIRGDFLFNTRNSRELVGKSCVFDVDDAEAHVFNNNIMRVRFKHGVDPQFVLYAMSYRPVADQLESMKSGTTNVAAIYYKNLSALEIPMPDALTQRMASKALLATRAACDRLAAVQRSKLTALDELKQSLLHQAFTGALTSKSTDQQLQAVA